MELSKSMSSDIQQQQRYATKLFIDGHYFEADKVLSEIAEISEKDRPLIALRRAQIGMLSDNMAHVEEQMEIARPIYGAHVYFVGLKANMALRKSDLDAAIASLNLLGRHARAHQLAGFSGEWYQIKELSKTPVPLNIEHTLPICEVSVNGTIGRFVIDTGTGDCLVDSDFARRAGLTFGHVDQASFAGGRRGQWHLTGIDELSIGASEFTKLPAMISPLAHAFQHSFADEGVDGIIGSELIRAVGGIDIDYEQAQFQLGSPELQAGEALWIGGTHYPLTPCQVNDQPVSTWFIDSGMSGVDLACSESAAQRYGAEFLKGDIQAFGGGGELNAKPLLIRDFRHAGYEYAKTPAAALPDFKMSKELGIRIGGIIGHGWLSRHRVKLDYRAMLTAIHPSSTALRGER